MQINGMIILPKKQPRDVTLGTTDRSTMQLQVPFDVVGALHLFPMSCIRHNAKPKGTEQILNAEARDEEAQSGSLKAEDWNTGDEKVATCVTLQV